MIVCGVLGALVGEVVAQAGEEACRDRDDALVSALALADEQSAFARPDIAEPQSQDLAAAQSTEQHRLNHCPVPPGAQGSQEQVHVRWVDHSRQGPRGPDQRDAPDGSLAGTPQGEPPGHGVLCHRGIAADDQVLIETGDRGQPTLDGAG